MPLTERQKAILNARRADRKARGLCRDCGGERVGDGITSVRCAPCAAHVRERNRRYLANLPPERKARLNPKERQYRQTVRQRRRDQGLCAYCGKHPAAPERVYCAPCLAEIQVRDHARRQRARDEEWRDGAPKRNLGPDAPRLEGRHLAFTLGLTERARQAFAVLRQRHREKCRAEGQTALTHQNSRIIRDLIRRYRDRKCPPHRFPDHPMQTYLHINLDAATNAILCRHALHFGNNKSSALRAMLINEVNPHPVATTGGRRALHHPEG
jgi:hypothetical protein